MGATPGATTPPPLGRLPTPLEAALTKQQSRLTTPTTDAKAFGSTIAPAFGGGRRATPSIVEERRRGYAGSGNSPLWWERVPQDSLEQRSARMRTSASSASLSGFTPRRCAPRGTTPTIHTARPQLDSPAPLLTAHASSRIPLGVGRIFADEDRQTSWRQPQRQPPRQPPPQWNTCLYSHVDSSLCTPGRPGRSRRAVYTNSPTAPWGVRSSSSLSSSSLSTIELDQAPSPAPPIGGAAQACATQPSGSNPATRLCLVPQRLAPLPRQHS